VGTDVRWRRPERLEAKHVPAGPLRRSEHTAAVTTPRVRMTGAQRREQLLDVGKALFAERGFDGTSVEGLALRAGVSKPVCTGGAV
jgi:hypothetical protein